MMDLISCAVFYVIEAGWPVLFEGLERLELRMLGGCGEFKLDNLSICVYMQYF